jgi:hypothetical protein
MPQFLYDKLNSFGTLAAAGTFPNTINLGETGVERMSVDLKTPEGALTATHTITLTVQGADVEAGPYKTIVTGEALTGAKLKLEGYGLPIPKNPYKFLRASVAGTFTKTVEAVINSYLGK